MNLMIASVAFALIAGCAFSESASPKGPAVFILHSYEDPARELWEITFRQETYIDAEKERPLSEFRLDSLAQHVNGLQDAMPVLFIFDVPTKPDVTTFTRFMLQVIQEANRVRLKYVMTFTCHDTRKAKTIRTSALPADVEKVLLAANGNCVMGNESVQRQDFLRLLSKREGRFRSRTLALIIEEGMACPRFLIHSL